jgi:hypothetical protein
MVLILFHLWHFIVCHFDCETKGVSGIFNLFYLRYCCNVCWNLVCVQGWTSCPVDGNMINLMWSVLDWLFTQFEDYVSLHHPLSKDFCAYLAVNFSQAQFTFSVFFGLAIDTVMLLSLFSPHLGTDFCTLVHWFRCWIEWALSLFPLWIWIFKRFFDLCENELGLRSLCFVYWLWPFIFWIDLEVST